MDRIKFSKSFEQFVAQTKDECKVSKYLHHYIKETNDVVCRNFTADKINYLTLRKNGAISYLPFGRDLKLNDDGEWSRDGRQEGKPAKTIQSIMRNALIRSLNNRDLEIFSNLYKGQATDLYTVREARGQDLADVYNLKIPFTSCMNGSGNQEKLELYVKNPSAVGVLYIQTKDVCQARALVWTERSGKKIIDRVYGSEEFQSMFRDYAKEIGAYKKVYDGAGSSDFFNPDGERVWKDFDILLEDTEVEYYPYVDTFCYLTDDTLSNLEDDCEKTLQSTDGGFQDMTGEECYGRSRRYPRDECSWSQYHDAFIHDEDSVCIGDDVYYAPDGSTEDAIDLGGGDYVLIDGLDEVEAFNPLDYDGMTEIDDVSTITCYKLPGGELIPTDDATVYTVFVIDGEIIGRD